MDLDTSTEPGPLPSRRGLLVGNQGLQRSEMKGFQGDRFDQRIRSAAEARKANVERFRARPGADDPEVMARAAERREIAAARQARAARKAEERRIEREQAAAEVARQQAAEEAARQAQAELDAIAAAEREAEKKAARDARYAARKAAKKSGRA
jgi:hypothetical protein